MGPGNRNDFLLDQIRRIAARQRLHQRTDQELLSRFAAQGDEEAFRCLIDRYGPMVLRVCQRVLGHDHDAEDACQATFLVLASKAGSRQWQESIAAWLQAVAVRVARQARRAAQRRHTYEQCALDKPGSNPLTEVSVHELHQLLEEELARLPEAYRAPLVQHYLMGQRQEEIASQLGCSLRTLTRRLQLGRQLLQKRLAARGATVTGVLLAVMLGDGAGAAAMPAALTTSTLRAVLLFRTGQGIAAASPAASALAAATIQGMTAGRRKIATILVAVLLLTVGSAVAAWLKLPGGSPTIPPAPAATLEQKGQTASSAKHGQDGPKVVLSGRVLDAAGLPVPNASVVALARRPFQAGDHGLREDVLAVGRADTEGHFQLTVPADFPSWYPDRQVVLVATAPGHAPTTLPVSTLSAQGLAELRLGATGTIRGRLLDWTGQPAVGVRVQVVRLGDAAWEPVQGDDVAPPPFWPGPVYSDEHGDFDLRGLDAGRNVWLQFQDDRYELTTVPVKPAANAVYHLGPARLLRGQVLNAETGKPFAHVRLAVFAGEWEQEHHERYTALTAALPATRTVSSNALDGRTDVQGRFKLNLPTANTYRVDVFPPAGSAHLALTRQLRWAQDTTSLEEEFRLPRGIELRGRVVEDKGAKAVSGAVAFFQSQCLGNPHYRADVLCGRNTLATSTADGCFKLIVPPGPGTLFVYGPRWEFLSQVLDPASLVPGPKRPLRCYTDGVVRLKVPASAKVHEVHVTLQRGVAVAGRVTGPNGKPCDECVLVCSGKVVSLRNRVVAALPAFGGSFLLPGCDASRAYRVVFLDAKNKCGTLAEIPGNAGQPPIIRLEPCGTASVRVLGPDGRPSAGCRLVVEMFLEPDTAIADAAAQAQRKMLADPYAVAWVDPLNYAEAPTTDAAGMATLPALVPGVRYRVAICWRGTWTILPPFSVQAGQTRVLPDLRLRDSRLK
jgi:RNA polymerase sigma factor (sigma-70 family)